MTNNQQQTVTSASNHDRHNSAGSSGPLSMLASVSAAQAKAWTR
jgi:hypothetical protein